MAHREWAQFPGKEPKVKRKRYSRKFQRMAVERMRTSDDVVGLARELGVTRRCLYKWRTKRETAEPGEEASRPSTHEHPIARKSFSSSDSSLRRRWRWIFSKVPCKKSRLDASAA